MAIRITTQSELERILSESFINGTSIVNKVSPNSITSAFIKANSRAGTKAYKELKLSVSSILPNDASGDQLDEAANIYGISERLGARASSVVVKIFADPGTFYDASAIVVNAGNGIIYEFLEDLTVGTTGIAYARARSQSVGADTTIEAFDISSLSPAPTGHSSVTNPFSSFGGADAEDDDAFRERIVKGANIVATGTLDKFAEIFRRVNENVLRVFYYGTADNGKLRLGVVASNGQDFTQGEFDQMLSEGSKYFSVSELSIAGSQSQSIQLENIEFDWIDLDFRLEILQNFDFVETLREIQTNLQSLIDFRFWEPGDKVEWENILTTVQNTRGVRYVPDSTFLPRADLNIKRSALPRFRDFKVRDLQGNIIFDNAVITPIFFPDEQNLVEFGNEI